MGEPNHFSSPLLSIWQAAVAKVFTSPATQHVSDAFSAIERAPVDFKNEYIVAGARAAANSDDVAKTAPVNPVERCASAALELAIAKSIGDDARAAAAQAKLATFGDCDARWAECVLEHLAHYSMTKRGNVPYRKWKQIDDFLEDTLPVKCRIAIIGDWGTGDIRAQQLLEKVGEQKPDLLVHLGDIYYACTSAEAERFRSNVRKVFGTTSKTRVLTLCGNHDMYSGAAPFYALLDELGQKASFFCLRNADWQLMAADTGYNDFDYREEGKVSTWVRDYDVQADGSKDSYSELAWHHRRLTTSQDRRTILLTHHQPFSANSAIDGGSALNRRLLGQFSPFLTRIPIWIWGHEHNQVIYKRFAGVERGRCVGASAVPVAADEQPYSIDSSIRDGAPVVVNEASKLTVDKSSDLYKLGFALLDLDGGACTERYYEFDATSGKLLENFTSSF